MPYLLDSQSKIIVYHYGGRGSGIRSKHGAGEQDFIKIREECLREKKLFQDIEFPAQDSSVFFQERFSSLKESFAGAELHWKRPHEICTDPHFIVKDGSRFDVQQGALGNCWLVSAVAALPLQPCVFKQVVPLDNGGFDHRFMKPEGYCGLFHFRIWQYGKWIDVVVDDLLPCNAEGQLLFMHSTQRNEFWSALIEKSYAKLHGSYEALAGGLSYEALEDFTGGVALVLAASPEDPFPPGVFNIVLKAHERSALLACSTPNAADGTIEGKGPKGLVLGHAYSVTDCKQVTIPTAAEMTSVSLLRVRNPWGQETEWEGDWSDSSAIWKFIPESIKKEIDLSFDPDGEFWVSFEDFSKNFETLEIVYLSPDSINFTNEEEELKDARKMKTFSTSFFAGAWVKGLTAGGREDKFAINPQYVIELEEADVGEEECTVIIALMQKNRRALKEKFGDDDLLSIRFDVFKVQNPQEMPQPYPASFFLENSSYCSPDFTAGLREVTKDFKLTPGTYCIVPSLETVEHEGQFILRVFSEAKNNLKANEEGVKLGVGVVGETKVATTTKSITLDKKEPNQTFLNKFFNIMLCFDPCAQVTELDLQRSTQGDSCGSESGIKKRLSIYFKSVAGTDKEINSEQLSKILGVAFRQEFQLDGLSEEVCRSLIALEDLNKTGTLDIQEFVQLWKRLSVWITWFKEYDKDNSGYLDASELRQSLAAAGHYVPTKILQSFVIGCGDKNRRISFMILTTFMLKLKAMTEIFQDHDIEDSGKAIFTLDQWLEFALLMS